MPKFETKENSELKQYLKFILSDENTNLILDSIVNNETEDLWNFVVGYKLIAHNLKRLRINDPELAFLVGNFLGKYDAIEKLHKKFEDKKEFNSSLDNIIANSDKAVDILSDLYMAPAISYGSLNSKYEGNVTEELRIMDKEKVIEKLEEEKECYYMLTKESRRYMKEKYFQNFDIEEEKEEKVTDSFRSKALHLLREENKKEE